MPCVVQYQHVLCCVLVLSSSLLSSLQFSHGAFETSAALGDTVAFTNGVTALQAGCLRFVQAWTLTVHDFAGKVEMVRKSRLEPGMVGKPGARGGVDCVPVLSDQGEWCGPEF